MRIREVFWIETFADKIQSKHGVSQEEVEFVLSHRPHIRFSRRGNVEGEDLYAAFGQTAAGRYLFVVFIQKPDGVALPISARSMTPKEKRSYARQKKRPT